jgi:hypothetical protein
MPLIASIIAKALVFVDALLGAFATIEPGTVDTSAWGVNANCGAFEVLNATITPCGAAVAQQLAALANVGLAALGAILSGLLAV